PYALYFSFPYSTLFRSGVFLISFAGQFITEHLFGNGISLILLTGILASYFSDAQALGSVLTANKHLPLAVLSCVGMLLAVVLLLDRKSTRLNSSHFSIS